MNPRRISLALGAAAGGLLAAGLLTMATMAAASADQQDFVPDPFTFQPSQVTGDPPYTPEVVMGTESWSLFDLTTNQVLQKDFAIGVDTHTVFGSFVNDDFADSGVATVDLTSFGGGWANEWINDPIGGVQAADLLLTPFGNFELFGPAGVFGM
jgi:hypothetical protein